MFRKVSTNIANVSELTNLLLKSTDDEVTAESSWPA